MNHQTSFILLCSIAAVVLALGWFISSPDFEPVIVFLLGLAGIASIYWPTWRKTYANSRKTGRATFDYSNNNGQFSIGSGDQLFETKWTKASDVSIHVYNDPASIDSVALAAGVHAISEVKDAAQYDFTSRTRTPREGEIVILKNTHGNYAALLIQDIKDRTREDDRDELTFSYAINADGNSDFSTK